MYKIPVEKNMKYLFYKTVFCKCCEIREKKDPGQILKEAYGIMIAKQLQYF